METVETIESSDSLPKIVNCFICLDDTPICDIKFCNNVRCAVGICYTCIKKTRIEKCSVCTLWYRVDSGACCISCGNKDDLHLTVNSLSSDPHLTEYLCENCGVDCYYCDVGYSELADNLTPDAKFLYNLIGFKLKLCKDHIHMAWDRAKIIHYYKFSKGFNNLNKEKFKYVKNSFIKASGTNLNIVSLMNMLNNRPQ